MDRLERIIDRITCAIGVSCGVGIALRIVGGMAHRPWLDQVGNWLCYPAGILIAAICIGIGGSAAVAAPFVFVRMLIRLVRGERAWPPI